MFTNLMFERIGIGESRKQVRRLFRHNATGYRLQKTKTRGTAGKEMPDAIHGHNKTIHLQMNNVCLFNF